jgi:hypothetical protein
MSGIRKIVAVVAAAAALAVTGCSGGLTHAQQVQACHKALTAQWQRGDIASYPAECKPLPAREVSRIADRVANGR